MKYIFKKMGKYGWEVSFSLTIKALATIGDLVLPFLLAYMIDELLPVTTRDNYSKMIYVGLIMLGVAVIGLIFNILSNRMAMKVASYTAYDIRGELFYKIEHLDAKQVDDLTTSSLVSRLTSDTHNIYWMVGSLQRLGIRAPMLLIGGIIMASFMDLTLTLIMISLLPFIVIIVWFYAKQGRPLFTNIQIKIDTLIRVLRENITGQRVVRALSMSNHENERFNIENDRAAKSEIHATITMNKIRPLLDIIMNVGLVGVLILGAFRVSGGETKVGQIMALMSYFTLILNAMSSITRIFIQTSRASASAKRITEVLSQPKNMVDGDLDVLPNNEPHISFKNVNFSYYNKGSQITDISFDLYQGQTLGIIGATGSGKTTLINLLMRFYDVNEGEIKVFGQNIKDLKRDLLRQHIGVVNQNDVVFSNTIYENIRFSRPDILEEDITLSAEIAQASYIDQMSDRYNYEVSQRGTNISGGQRQRLLIARAIAGKPSLLILDDASSALDYQTDRNLRDALDEHLKTTTKIIIAQRIASIKDADLILLIEDGKVVAKGNHNQLSKTNEHYQLLIEHQLGVDL